MARIVSLLPSTTEIACALGFEAELVGRSHECDFPPSLASLPVLTAPKLDVDVSSAEIDDRVRRLVSDGLSVYRVDAPRLRELAPTHILTQDHCDVCAASLADVEAALADWLDARPRVVSLRPAGFADVLADLQHVATALDAPERGLELARALAARVDAIRARATALPTRPRVACIEWLEPLMAAGNWMPELVGFAGGVNLFGEAGSHSPRLAWKDLRAADPDVIVVLPCGFDLRRTRAEMPPLLAQPGFDELRAVRDGRVYLVDGNQYFNRPGPRLVDSLELLTEMLHPDAFGSDHLDSAWQPL